MSLNWASGNTLSNVTCLPPPPHQCVWLATALHLAYRDTPNRFGVHTPQVDVETLRVHARDVHWVDACTQPSDVARTRCYGRLLPPPRRHNSSHTLIIEKTIVHVHSPHTEQNMCRAVVLPWAYTVIESMPVSISTHFTGTTCGATRSHTSHATQHQATQASR